jgi:hypothetical protein
MYPMDSPSDHKVIYPRNGVLTDIFATSIKDEIANLFLRIHPPMRTLARSPRILTFEALGYMAAVQAVSTREAKWLFPA